MDYSRNFFLKKLINFYSNHPQVINYATTLLNRFSMSTNCGFYGFFILKFHKVKNSRASWSFGGACSLTLSPIYVCVNALNHNNRDSVCSSCLRALCNLKNPLASNLEIIFGGRGEGRWWNYSSRDHKILRTCAKAIVVHVHYALTSKDLCWIFLSATYGLVNIGALMPATIVRNRSSHYATIRKDWKQH